MYPAFLQDREVCFAWFLTLLQSMNDETNLKFVIYFFEFNILRLDPSLMTEAGFELFSRFFEILMQNLTNERKRELLGTLSMVSYKFGSHCNVHLHMLIKKLDAPIQAWIPQLIAHRLGTLFTLSVEN